jgi:hypothetical protein
VVGSDDDRGGNQHTPIAVESQKCQGSEDMKNAFQSAHRRDGSGPLTSAFGQGDRVARDGFAWLKYG